jgi:hypothetical protein
VTSDLLLLVADDDFKVILLQQIHEQQLKKILSQGFRSCSQNFFVAAMSNALVVVALSLLCCAAVIDVAHGAATVMTTHSDENEPTHMHRDGAACIHDEVQANTEHRTIRLTYPSNGKKRANDMWQK